ncbi:uncharacterized protein LOC120359557 [Solenopsis invicta]|uniref:uncharacterized protein LOC120359557 n=1 Tax=Solenopsis invicta TaxID=13686 RepID=UPI00193D7AB3|nr:uncharacterized protein LOC120359557 [Solenopsis invicta]
MSGSSPRVDSAEQSVAFHCARVATPIAILRRGDRSRLTAPCRRYRRRFKQLVLLARDTSHDVVRETAPRRGIGGLRLHPWIDSNQLGPRCTNSATESVRPALVGRAARLRATLVLARSKARRPSATSLERGEKERDSGRKGATVRAWERESVIIERAKEQVGSGRALRTGLPAARGTGGEPTRLARESVDY